jgi:hypothetical protein
MHPVEALAFACNFEGIYSGDTDFLSEWYTFFASYILGKVYQVPGTVFLSGISNDCIFDINTSEDTIKIFQGLYPDLSSKLYRINLNDQKFKEEGSLEFSITGGSAKNEDLAGCLFGYQNDSFSLLGEMGQLFETGDFSSFSSLYFLLCNTTANRPFTGNSSVELTIQAKRKKKLPYANCQVELTVLGDHLVERDPPDVDPYHSSFNVFNTWKFVGSCDENSFTGSLDPSYHPESRHGTLNVNFDEDLNITRFDLTCYDRDLKADTLAWEIVGVDLAKTYESGSSLIHEKLGSGVCTSLQGLFNYSESTHASGGTVQYTVVNHSCNDFSLLKFMFRN